MKFIDAKKDWKLNKRSENMRKQTLKLFQRFLLRKRPELDIPKSFKKS